MIIVYTGTVVGAVFSYFIFLIFDCPNSSKCDNEILMPLIIIWVFICGFFRDGPRHGYSGVTAAITPIVLLIGE